MQGGIRISVQFLIFALIVQHCLCVGPPPRYDLTDSSDRGRKIAEKESLSFGAWADNTVNRLFLLYNDNMQHVCSLDLDPDFYAYEADAGQGRIVLSGTYYSSETVVLKVYNVPPAWNNADPYCTQFREINQTTVESFRDDILRVAVTKNGNLAIAMSTQHTVIFDLRNLTCVIFPHVFPASQFLYVRGISLESNFGIVTGYYRANVISFNVRMYYFTYNSTTISLGSFYNVQLLRPVNRPDKYFLDHEISLASNNEGLVLLGIPQSNFVVMVDVSSGTFVSRGTRFGLLTEGGNQDVGYGKSVAWSLGNAVILSQNNDPNHEVHFISVRRNGLPPLLSSTSPTVFKYPNYQMIPPSYVGKRFYQLGGSEYTVGILAERYHGILVNATKPGWYWDTSYSLLPTAFARPCPAGTQKLSTGFGSCSFCGEGTYNNGSFLACQPCPSGSVCTGGSVAPMLPELVHQKSQVFKYYEGVADQFDDLIVSYSLYLPDNMACLVRRPSFWAYVFLALVPILSIVIVAMKRSAKESHRKKSAGILRFLMDFDIVKEGESYVGGMVTLTVVVIMIGSAHYTFMFVNLYPVESVDAETLTCGMHPNTRFETSMETLSVPLPQDLDYLITRLREQDFVLVFELLSTAATCTGVEVGLAKTDALDVNIPFACNRTADGRLVLESHISDLASTHTIKIPSSVIASGVKLGLKAPGGELVGPGGASVHVSHLDFSEPFHKDGYVLERNPAFSIMMTAVVNATEPIQDEPFVYSGLWVPGFYQDTSADSLFADEDTFGANTQGYIFARVQISENYYFVKNYQSPIVREGGALFALVLWVLSVIDIFGLTIFLSKYLWKRVSSFAETMFGKKVRIIGSSRDIEEDRWVEYVQEEYDRPLLDSDTKSGNSVEPQQQPSLVSSRVVWMKRIRDRPAEEGTKGVINHAKSALLKVLSAENMPAMPSARLSLLAKLQSRMSTSQSGLELTQMQQHDGFQTPSESKPPTGQTSDIFDIAPSTPRPTLGLDRLPSGPPVNLARRLNEILGGSQNEPHAPPGGDVQSLASIGPIIIHDGEGSLSQSTTKSDSLFGLVAAPQGRSRLSSAPPTPRPPTPRE